MIYILSLVRIPTVTFVSFAIEFSSTTMTLPSFALAASRVTAAAGTTISSLAERVVIRTYAAL